jgi:hypothetical protein
MDLPLSHTGNVKSRRPMTYTFASLELCLEEKSLHHAFDFV